MDDNRRQCNDNCKDTGQHGERVTRVMRSRNLNCSTHIKPQATQWKDTPRGAQEGKRASITCRIPGNDYEQCIIDKCKFLFRKICEVCESTRPIIGCFRQVEQCIEPMLNIYPGEPEEEQDMESSHKAPNPLLLHLAIKWPIWPAAYKL